VEPQQLESGASSAESAFNLALDQARERNGQDELIALGVGVQPMQAGFKNLTGSAAQENPAGGREGLQPGQSALKTAPGNMGPGGKLLPQGAERMALGANTASAIAGPKPWDREWVFAGREKNPQLETLFQDRAAPELERLLAAVQKQVKGSESMLEGEVPPSAPLVREKSVAQAPETKQVSLGSKSAVANAPQTEGAQATVKGASSEIPSSSPLAGIPPELLAALGMGGELSEASEAFEGGTSDEARGMKPPLRKAPGTSALGGSLGGDDFLATRGAAAQSKGVSALGARHDAGSFLKDSRDSESRSDAFAPRGEVRSTTGARPRSVITDLGARQELPVLAQGQLSAREGVASAIAPRAIELKGHVTMGAMARNRLSSESLMGMTSSIRTIAGDGVQPASGEMRIRLNPENLGELSLKVSTRGKEVGLQIRASNEDAKRVLEESLGHLRENLASNSLNLARVEVLLDRGSLDSGSFGSQGQQSQQQHQFQPNGQNQPDLSSFGNFGGNSAGSFGQSNFGRDSERSSRDESDGAVGLSRPRVGGLGPVMNLRSTRAGDSGRVDVMA